MKKYMLIVISVLVIITQVHSEVLAASNYKSGPLPTAIRKYKAGNYTGCLQDTQLIVKRDPSNAVAYYYMAMSYAQAGKQDKAIEAYGRVLALRPNATLYKYATTGKRCLETPDKCKDTDQSSEVDKMIAAPFGDGLSTEVRDAISKKRLEAVKNEINSKEEIDEYKLRNFKDYTNQRTQLKTEDKVASVEKQPTNDEIVAAMKVLQKAGLSSYSQANAEINPYAQMTSAMQSPQSAEMAQISMMLNGNNQSNNNNNNAMMNMIPYMLAQKGAAGNGSASYAPQMMQTMLMNSMLPDFNFNTDKDK